MGEYANYAGQYIKIGTCEDMYYLRADQRFGVMPELGSVHPNTVGLRYRFPWPDEDNIAPGAFEDYGRAVPVDVPMPPDVDHNTVQFHAHAGYVCSLPCPEGPDSLPDLTIHRNGFSGAVKLVRQKLMPDRRLVPVCMCGGCSTMWRVEDPADIEALAVAFRAEGDRRVRQSRSEDPREGAFWQKIADRILDGAGLSHAPKHNPVCRGTQ